MEFLKAEWKNLVMCNWQIEQSLLAPFLPAGTELDLFDGAAYVSLVAFQFLRTRVLGVAVPYHVNFEEINLRFYVKRNYAGQEKRGVVFIKEFVPRFWIAFIARALYNENYFSVPTKSQIETLTDAKYLCYEWENTNRMEVSCSTNPQALISGSLEEFIAQHYYGYAKQRDGGTVEYRVEHPQWQIRTITDLHLNCDFKSMYGQEFSEIMLRQPDNCFVADGSTVQVKFGHRIRLF